MFRVYNFTMYDFMNILLWVVTVVSIDFVLVPWFLFCPCFRQSPDYWMMVCLALILFIPTTVVSWQSWNDMIWPSIAAIKFRKPTEH